MSTILFMEMLKYCLYGSIATVILGLIIYIFILRNKIKKLNTQIEDLKIELENSKVELLTQGKNSELKIIELETELKYLKQSQKNSSETKKNIENIEKSDDVKTDINDLINKYNEKNN